MSIKRLGNGGFAVPATLGLMGMVVVLGLAAVAASTTERQGAHSFVSSGQAFWAAEAGLDATLAAWNQTALNTSLPKTGDSLVGSWTNLPNNCSYRTVIRRVDGRTGRAHYEVSSTGRSREGTRTVAMMVLSPVVQVGNAITVGGSLELSGASTLTGNCAHVHVNGSLLKVGGDMSTTGEVSSSGTVTGEDKIEDEDGDPIDPTEGAPQQPIPAMLPSDYCDQADYRFTGKKIYNAVGIQVANINGSQQMGWEWTSGKYVLKSTTPTATGTLCFDDDVEFIVSPGLRGPPAIPIAMSIITTMSITVPGDPYMVSDHPDGILFLALGDVRMAGNASPGTENFQGTIYANSQCDMSGQVNLEGRLICRDQPNPLGSENWSAENKISGLTSIDYSCSDDPDAAIVSPISARPWLQVIR